MDQRFRWNDRLHRKADFTRAIREGRRYSASGLVLWVYRGADAPEHPRLGLAVPRAYGNAVARNRLKRLLREVFRLRRQELDGGMDLVYSARSGAFGLPFGSRAARLGYAMVEPVVFNLWKKAQLLKS